MTVFRQAALRKIAPPQEPGRQKASKRKLAPARTVFDDFAGKYPDICQESGEKWTAAANLQPTSFLLPRLLKGNQLNFVRAGTHADLFGG